MYLYTELVRILEQRGHLFPSDPLAITELLRHADGTVQEKLNRRAAMIDRDQQLLHRLESFRQRLQLLAHVSRVLWLALGFLGTYQLMQQGSLNFLMILVGILGMNWLMLLVWCVSLFGKPRHIPPMLASVFSGSKDSVEQAIFEVYAQSAMKPHARWRLGEMSHQHALCALVGMFLAVLLLLLVRQYSFNWESTLLNGSHFAGLVAVLSWLPEKLGFAVPSAEIVKAAQNAFHYEHAAAWGSLLLGSIVCYGCLPRLMAWVVCRWQMSRSQPELDLDLPYYRDIVLKWQQRVVDDAADYRADEVALNVPKVALNADGTRWAVLLDALAPDDNWCVNVLGLDWQNRGAVADRAALGDLLAELETVPVQLLVGVRAKHVPDRGVVRQLGKLSQAAQAGLVVMLLPDVGDDVGSLKTDSVAEQWRVLLRERGWAWVE
ncbi:DUF2868 domain-containing protein [Kingella negevensis]|uniref:DUF2868 domain-containing protein n=1 Tax=Kingella negevensis TaxID=1522312 RepID=UPI002543C1DC|nr:DUF2868 domain-containing protein [Kingella negevensis]MDK4680972.1 DUF2868 domain-containing protein [Kingella negevensis]MDK4683174.1 DUF2868 domain-containing protein [Kingella negevensis]MDK4691694.1 DUF2868 domain-containing protein [Kingella negevensis]MDK4693154.1 DUF2868 domain-containing protein [Kingella negevensis]MDK4699455.1 DUF2868 domain-containing protein [Kingella negevensis]